MTTIVFPIAKKILWSDLTESDSESEEEEVKKPIRTWADVEDTESEDENDEKKEEEVEKPKFEWAYAEDTESDEDEEKKVDLPSPPKLISFEEKKPSPPKPIEEEVKKPKPVLPKLIIPDDFEEEVKKPKPVLSKLIILDDFEEVKKPINVPVPEKTEQSLSEFDSSLKILKNKSILKSIEYMNDPKADKKRNALFHKNAERILEEIKITKSFDNNSLEQDSYDNFTQSVLSLSFIINSPNILKIIAIIPYCLRYLKSSYQEFPEPKKSFPMNGKTIWNKLFMLETMIKFYFDERNNYVYDSKTDDKLMYSFASVCKQYLKTRKNNMAVLSSDFNIFLCYKKMCRVFYLIRYLAEIDY